MDTESGHLKATEPKSGEELGPPHINEEHLLVFTRPLDPSPEQQLLLARLVELDHKAKRGLVPPSPQWREVSGVLLNAAISLTGGQWIGSKELVDHAERLYYAYIEERNRVKYVLGVLVGSILAGVISSATLLAFGDLLRPLIRPQLMELLFLFAGFGSLTSVLTRLTEIDLKKETSASIVLLSGAARPVVAIFFSIVAYFILDSGVVGLAVPDTERTNETFLVVAFLVGFSERFAKDIFARVTREVTAEEAPREGVRR
jgi:hypothetical protein